MVFCLVNGVVGYTPKSEVHTLVDKIVCLVKEDISTSLRKEYGSSLAEVTKTLTAQIKDLQKKYDEVKVTKWPAGSYCVLANGACPTGFKNVYGYMRAISLFAGTNDYIKPATFGTSRIQCHGKCGQFGHWTGELHLSTCCK